MKTKILLSVFSFLSFLCTYAQQHLPESKSLIGLWQHIALVKNNLGEFVTMKSGNYKVMNTDDTFYTFLILRGNNNHEINISSLNMYGTYSITSDSTFTEHVIKNSANPMLDNSDSKLKYKFLPDSDNNLIYLIYKNTTNDQWIPEMWERVSMPQKRNTTEKHSL